MESNGNNSVIKDVIKNIISNSSSDTSDSSNASKGDYIKNGVLICGKCRNAKQKFISMPYVNSEGSHSSKTLVRVMCKCEQDARSYEELRFKNEELRRNIEQLKESSLIEPRLKNARIESFKFTKDNEKLFVVAKKYIDNFDNMYKDSQGLLLYGSIGTGKSYTAAVIANELLNRGVSVIMTSFVKILQQIKDIRIDESEYIRRINSAKLLILDDLGTERDTGYAMEKVYNIVDSRYLSRKPMIVTTNLTLAEMQNSTDLRYKRVYDRIFEMCYPVHVSGRSWRLEEAARRFDNMQMLLEG